MSYAGEVLTDGPLLHWRLGEASGTTATDASGNGHDGTFFGAVALGVPGLLSADPDTAVAFDGTGDDQYVKSNDDLGNTTYPAWTMELWISGLTADDEGGKSLLILVDATYDHWIACYTGILSGSDIMVSIDWMGVSGASGSINAMVPIGSTASHLAFTYDGTTVKGYLNGVLADSATDATGAADFGGVSAFLFAGGDNLGFADGMFGVVDEAAFYTHALTSTRVAAHTAAASGGSAPAASADGCIALSFPGFVADGVSVDADLICYTVQALDGWFDSPPVRTGTLEAPPVAGVAQGEAVVVNRKNGRDIDVQIVAHDLNAQTPLGNSRCFLAIEAIKTAFRLLYVPALFDVVDPSGLERTMLARRVGPIKSQILGAGVAVRFNIPMLGEDPRLV